ncbi:MAG: hypothetical protein K8S16_19975 [Bacteroidales bacterium]|nr:hypothetical protein [Bacteroidales bacterium]
MKKSVFAFLTLFIITNLIYASSPVTLVSFYQDYSFLEEVRIVEQSGMLDGRVMPFLLNENNPIDQKAAIINALVNTEEARRNASTFSQFVARKYKENFETLDLNKLNGDELFCLGYFTLIDDMGQPENALPILELALSKNKQSRTVNLIYTLAKAQEDINSGDHCKAWQDFNNTYTNLTLNQDIGNNITTYFLVEMENHKEGCE